MPCPPKPARCAGGGSRPGKLARPDAREARRPATAAPLAKIEAERCVRVLLLVVRCGGQRTRPGLLRLLLPGAPRRPAQLCVAPLRDLELLRMQLEPRRRPRSDYIEATASVAAILVAVPRCTRGIWLCFCFIQPFGCKATPGF